MSCSHMWISVCHTRLQDWQVFAFIRTTMCQLLIALRDSAQSKTFTPLPLQPACNCYSYIASRKRKGNLSSCDSWKSIITMCAFFFFSPPESLTCYLPINSKSFSVFLLLHYCIMTQYRKHFPFDSASRNASDGGVQVSGG